MKFRRRKNREQILSKKPKAEGLLNAKGYLGNKSPECPLVTKLQSDAWKMSLSHRRIRDQVVCTQTE